MMEQVIYVRLMSRDGIYSLESHVLFKTSHLPRLYYISINKGIPTKEGIFGDRFCIKIRSCPVHQTGVGRKMTHGNQSGLH